MPQEQLFFFAVCAVLGSLTHGYKFPAMSGTCVLSWDYGSSLDEAGARLVDVNGDGLVDWVCSVDGKTNGNFIYLNNGAGFVESSQVPQPVLVAEASLHPNFPLWTRDDVYSWAVSVVDVTPVDASKLWNHRIRGRTLQVVEKSDLVDMGLTRGAVLDIVSALAELKHGTTNKN